jgi:hypothetical protein
MKLQNFLEQGGFDIRPYSGRGMFGKQCVASATNNIAQFLRNVILDILTETIDELITPEEAKDYINTLFAYSQDNLGLDMIIYWPNQKWEVKDA